MFCQYIGRAMRNESASICGQRRPRSACASAQSDKDIHCPLAVSLDTIITKTYLYNSDPLKPNFYIVKLGFTGVYIIFLISAQKHRLWVLVRTASNEYLQSMFWTKIWNISVFFIGEFSFFGGQISVYLNRRVFVMRIYQRRASNWPDKTLQMRRVNLNLFILRILEDTFLLGVAHMFLIHHENTPIKIQLTLVILNSFISNNRLSRSENLVPVLTQRSTNRQQSIVEKRRNCS